MKNNWIVSCLIAVFVSAFSMAQDQMPNEVEEAFAKQYVDATLSEINQSDNDHWTVHFVTNSGTHQAVYNAKGQWIDTRSEMELSDLPKEVASTLNDNYAGYLAFSAAKYTSPGAKGYAVKVRDGADLVEVILDPEGNVVRPASIEEDN